MKHFVLVGLLILLALPTTAQFARPDTIKPRLNLTFETSKSWRIARPFVGFTLGFVSGTAKGVREVIINDYHSFRRKYPNANHDWWDHQGGSWLNKYKNRDPKQGPAFPGATTFGVVVTDAYHFLPEIERYAYGAGVVVVSIGERRKWWQYGLELLAVQAGYWAGMNLTYHGHFNK